MPGSVEADEKLSSCGVSADRETLVDIHAHLPNSVPIHSILHHFIKQTTDITLGISLERFSGAVNLRCSSVGYYILEEWKRDEVGSSPGGLVDYLLR